MRSSRKPVVAAFARAFVTLGVAVTMGGCCDDKPGYVEAAVSSSGDDSGHVTLWLGDTVTVYGNVSRDFTPFCDPIIYSTIDHRERFTFAVDDSSVATVTPRRFLVVRALG